MHRARGRLRTDEVRHELQTLLALRYGQVKMDFAFFAIAFNIKKMCSKINKKARESLLEPLIRPIPAYLWS